MLVALWPRRGSTCCRDEAEVMGYSWMVDECVCDHFGNESGAYNIQEEEQQISDMSLNDGRDHLNRRRGGKTLRDLGNRIKVTCFVASR